MTWGSVILASLKLWTQIVSAWSAYQQRQAGRAEANLDALMQQAEDENAIYDALGDLRSRIVDGKLPDNLYRD